MIGFGDLPKSPLSLIDIHGVNDDTIPYDLDHSNGQGNIIIDSHGVYDDLDQAEGQGNTIINSHGVNDNIIHYDLEHADAELLVVFGQMGKLLYFIDLSLILDILGPHESVISWDGYYYEEKAKTIAKWVDGLGCSGPQTYETPMDGQTDFACKVI